MALTTQNANLVWAKVKLALLGQSSTGGAPTPVAQEAFQDLKKYLAQQKGNVNLQFAAFAAEDIVTNNGSSAIGGACTLYGVYAKGRRTSGTTSAFFAIHDASDNSATTTTIVTSRFKATGQEFVGLYGNGIAIATDVLVSCATTVGGATESSAADAADGFVIVGA
jgi:hypothetical protein